MEILKGISIEHLGLDNLKKVSDLVYYDGPLLSHYSNDSDNYLFYWVDTDDTYNRWLVFRVSIEQINGYLNNELILLDVIKNSLDDFVYSVDIDNDLNYHNIKILSYDELPTLYLGV